MPADSTPPTSESAVESTAAADAISGDASLFERVSAYLAEHSMISGVLLAAVVMFTVLLLLQKIPLKYTVRSLRSRWTSSLMTVFGTALVVWASVLAFGLAAGLDHTLEVSGDPLDLIVMRKGSNAEIGSIVTEENAEKIRNLPGIALISRLPDPADAPGLSTDLLNSPACSPEMVVVVNRARRNNGGSANLVLRGVKQVGFLMRPGFRLTQGHMPSPGKQEAIASRSIAERFEGAGLGETLSILGESFSIVGIFEAGDSAAESEVWTDYAILAGASKRDGVLSSVQVRAESPAAFARLRETLQGSEEYDAEAIPEVQYFRDQAAAGIVIKVVGYMIAGCLIFGSMFAVANTMFGAVMSRSREIGTLRALGFSRLNVMTNFLLESLILCLVGGALGCLATLPLNGLSTGTANWATFSEITFAFRFGWTELLRGASLAVMTGVVGGMFPAIRSSRMKIVNALREV